VHVANKSLGNPVSSSQVPPSVAAIAPFTAAAGDDDDDNERSEFALG
jgi:hypothetical protein